MRFRPLPEEMQAVARQIEVFLLTQTDWVPDKVLEERYGIGERQLRADDLVGRPGLLEEFAISSGKGFKHLSLATVDERLKAKHRVRRTAISYLRRWQRQDAAIHNCVKGLRPQVVERQSGQILLGLQEPRRCAHVGPRAVQSP